MPSSARSRLPAALLLGALSGCSLLFPDHPPEYEPATLASGLVVQDVVVPRTGPRAKTGDRVTINYEGRLESGEVFDSSYDRGVPITFELGAGEVPAGLDLGLVGLRVNGKRRLTVPSELGYGAEGVEGVVPPDSTLLFELELIELTAR
jgi:FKBP-type peptidyl-prolyl cis-trans isomerase